MKKHLLFLLSLFFLVGCSGYEEGNLELDGDCMIETIVLNDTIVGQVDLASRSVTFRLPEEYDSDVMVVTDLKLSEGAEANVAVGMQLCMREPRCIRVTNGNTFIEWTAKAKNDEAIMYSFKVNGIYSGIIDRNRNILVYVPTAVDVASLVPTAVVSEGATVSPRLGVTTNFTQPVIYTVTNGTACHQYTVKVVQVGKPVALFVSTAETMDQLNSEEMTACLLMLSQVPNSLYASFDDLRLGTIDLSECKVLWWHFHQDNGVNNDAAFELYGKSALDCKTVLQDYLNRGGSLLLTRYATFLPAYLSIGDKAATGRFPNNCWGGVENNAEEVSEPWSFFTDSLSHPIYADGVVNAEGRIYTCDAGYHITNSTAQWHIGTDWGGYPDYAYFTKKTGADVIGFGGDRAIVAWEWKRTEKNGGIICIGSGCLDYYSDTEVYTGYHENVEKITLNAINYLKQ